MVLGQIDDGKYIYFKKSDEVKSSVNILFFLAYKKS